MTISTIDALQSLVPTAEYVLYNAGTSDESLEWRDSSITQPSNSALAAEVTRLTNAEPMRLLRVERDRRLSLCDWVVTKATETGTTVSDTWKTYRQSLRDLPASASPKLDTNGKLDMTSVTFPTEPS
tara:strand:+ start:97 stop:477 length:381 start_codon:yes stop_codon:yes gene_type:complete